MFHVIIPARYASTRLPGKLLLDLNGKSVLQHTYERALKSGASSVVIATDDEHIFAAATKFGAKVCMTRPAHTSGTERLVEAVELLGFSDDEIVVNVQGDEPLIPAAIIHQVAEDLQVYPKADMATLYKVIKSYEELNNPHAVKVVFDKEGYALYFSRAPIACDRDAVIQGQAILAPHARYYRHIGIYAYRVSTLKRYMAWGSCYLEEMEALEQLRILWNGGRIHLAAAVERVPQDVNTAGDLELVRELLQKYPK